MSPPAERIVVTGGVGCIGTSACRLPAAREAPSTIVDRVGGRTLPVSHQGQEVHLDHELRLGSAHRAGLRRTGSLDRRLEATLEHEFIAPDPEARVFFTE